MAKRISDEIRSVLKRGIQEGLSARTLAAQHGVSEWFIYNLRRDMRDTGELSSAHGTPAIRSMFVTGELTAGKFRSMLFDQDTPEFRTWLREAVKPYNGSVASLAIATLLDAFWDDQEVKDTPATPRVTDPSNP